MPGVENTEPDLAAVLDLGELASRSNGSTDHSQSKLVLLMAGQSAATRNQNCEQDLLGSSPTGSWRSNRAS